LNFGLRVELTKSIGHFGSVKTHNSPLTVSHIHRHAYSSNGFHWRTIQSYFPTIETYYGSEFISKVMDKWAYERGIELD